MSECKNVDADDCKYGMPNRKRTRLWNNLVEFKPTDLLERNCGNIVDGRDSTKNNICLEKVLK